jgi:hypothetical protein
MIDRSYSTGITRALEPTVGRVTASDVRLDGFVAMQNGEPEREHRNSAALRWRSRSERHVVASPSDPKGTRRSSRDRLQPPL